MIKYWQHDISAIVHLRAVGRKNGSMYLSRCNPGNGNKNVIAVRKTILSSCQTWNFGSQLVFNGFNYNFTSEICSYGETTS